MEQTDADRKALEDFVVGNADLEKLEAMLDRFNIFEAVGMVSQEVRHSRFLSFLLDPKQPHGLGDAFLKRFLQSVVSGSDAAVVMPIELSLWNFDGMSVWREWNHIDIFLLDEENRLAVIVENKIGSKEHSDQLSRYYQAVREEYPAYRILAVYLTPNGDEPSHAEYLPLDYGTVCEMLDEVRQSKASVMEPDAAVLVRHYTDMMRRNIVGDSEIARLARQIYQKHQRAIDLIIENRPDPQSETRSLLEDLVRRAEKFVYRGKSRMYMWFYSSEWEVPKLNGSPGNSNAFLRFVFHNHPDNLALLLETDPGDHETRQRLYEMSLKDESLFKEPQNPEEYKWPKFYGRTFLTPEFCAGATDAEREAEIRRNWNDFLENDLPRIDAALRAEEWIWEDAPETAHE